MARANLDAKLPEIVKRIRGGAPINLACEAEGVCPSTLKMRMSRYPDLMTEITRARAEGPLALLDRVKGGDGPGQGFGPAKAALEVLQRVNPKQFAQRVNVKVEEELSGFLEVARRVLDEATYVSLLRAYSQHTNGDDSLDGLGQGSDPGEESEEGSA